ncbi:efflux RND transporter periplasmic adaptor subunit [Prosthecochloris sp. SCSIO W1101]|uniref:efflux RND transporter periplasmic adaptor subunit n=1 Tax=Prosthecochloris sp. SCSIO W1101 TaxID=2992242 RepID=UPI00223CA006|nr:efflux RND transporter periplasmic adaptor subunit [Prosthecochloris sp. SCSIO W1101]UZJ42668.1 efflux RND transporter periplasmic adaptor subunit [Prosthecochloris sp. SCSIO W1101]
MTFSKTQRITAISILALVGILIFVMKPSPLEVDAESIRRGTLIVTLDGEGMTRVRNGFTIASPVNGRVERIILDEGDFVRKNSVVARVTPPPLNTREFEEADARARSAKAVFEAARAHEREVRVDLDQAVRKYNRYQNLYRKGAVSAEAFEEVRTSWQMLQKQHQAAQLSVESARYDLEAALSLIDKSARGNTIDVFAPDSGRVLRVFEKSERVVSAGTPLVEIGNPGDIEVVIDVLSSDAVRVERGMNVRIEEWGGRTALEGSVKTVEPAAFTKISSLGIEEKRVNIIVDLEEPESRLGDNYRIQAKIILWQGEGILQVPISSIFRGDQGWNVFVIKKGKAVRQPITIGMRGTYYAEVLDGLEEEDVVVVHPTNDLEEGMRVKVMKRGK